MTKGLSQIGLAKSVGISASYLNLIEANKRDVGGSLLQRIAQHLGVELHELTGETEQRLISDLQEAFSNPVLEPLKLGLNDAHKAVAAQPELAKALNLCFRAYLGATANADAYSNRLKSDPLFSELLHQMLSQITAVRSSSEILHDVPDISDSDQKKFYATIHQQSLALSDVARTLIAQFDHEAQRNHSISPARELNDVLIEENNFFPDLEEAAAQIRKSLPDSPYLGRDILANALEEDFGVSVNQNSTLSPKQSRGKEHGFDAESNTLWCRPGIALATQKFQMARKLATLYASDVLNAHAADPRLTTRRARQAAFSSFSSYLASAILLPYDAFLDEAETSRYDLDFLAQNHTASFEQVSHRLISLRKPASEGIPFGFLRADASGYLSKQFPLPGLLLPNTGHACPLWAIYSAFQSLNTIVRQTVSFADGSRYLFIAKASTKRAATYAQQSVPTAILLACDLLHADKTVYGQGLNLDTPANDVPVGPSCRVCVRKNCAQRQEIAASNIQADPER